MKRFLYIILAVIMLTSVVHVPAMADEFYDGEIFTDVTDPGQYYYEPVRWAYEWGITRGFKDGSFGVGQECTRRELVIFLWRACGYYMTDETDPQEIFTDMDYYGPHTDTYRAVAWAVEQGIIRGYDDGTFRPDEPICRKDCLIILYRVCGKPEVYGNVDYRDIEELDLPATSDTYKSILWAQNEGITKGYDDGTFRPFDLALREQIITFQYRAYQYLINRKEPEPEPYDPGPEGWDETDRETFVAVWAERIDAYNEGWPLGGYGRIFAEAAYDYGVDPRWSPAIAWIESCSGTFCFRDHNAWGWGSVDWPDWESAIRDHVRGMAEGYGYTNSWEAAMKYCPGNEAYWYDHVAEEMLKIWPDDRL